MKGQGWHGNVVEHTKNGVKGGTTTAKRYGAEFYKKIGSLGGKNRAAKASKTNMKGGE